MENPYSDETFLARWLAGDLSAEEKLEFEKSDDFKKYLAIVTKVDTLAPPNYDRERVFNIIKKDINTDKKSVRLIPSWSYGIAAALLALFGLFFFFNNSTTYSTGFGEQITIELLDGSEVILNSKSELKFKKSEWEANRKVKLTGEAFFKVKKGSNFVVETASGNVEVLGTQFNVNTRKDYFEVICHEGKVKAIGTNEHKTVLTKGKAFRIANNISEKWDTELLQPSWISGETTFTNTPLKQVIHSLENQFDITFIKDNIDQNARFTGSYTHKNIKLALKTIFIPMEISYTFEGENQIVLFRK